MSQKPDTLYGRLPAIFRIRDAEQGQPLRALLRVIEEQLFALTADVETTWDNAFIETCEEWLIPYIGEQLGVTGVRAVEAIGFSQRGHVANTIRYRRRKGTLAVLEQLASDLTRYPARAVEFFQHIATTVHMQHVREPGALPARGGTAHVRDQRALLRVGTAFDAAAHTADVRHIAGDRGRYNIPNVGLFLYRVQSFEVSRASAVPIAGQPHFFRFHPLGLDAPLFNIADAETAIESLAREEHVPHRLRRRDLYAETVGDAPKLYLGDDPELSVRIRRGATISPPLTVHVCYLGEVGGVFPSWRPPFAGQVGVDPELGRLVLHPADVPGAADEVLVDYVYGDVAPVGAGPFDRGVSRLAQLGVDGENEVPFDFQIGVSRAPTTWPDGPVVTTMEAAVLAWNAHVAGLPPEQRREALGLIVVLDSRAYAAPTSTIRVPAGARLHLVAAAWTEGDGGGSLLPHRVRPLVRGGFKVEGQAAGGLETRAGGLWLNGLVVGGTLEVVAGDLRQLDAAHVTWPAGTDSIAIAAASGAGNAGLQLRLNRCRGGAVKSAGPVASLTLSESLLHGAVDLAGAAVVAASSTLIGTLRGQQISADNCLFTGKLTVAQTQEGCLRFCYLTRDSIAPRRYRCQPDQTLAGIEDEALRAEILARVRPRFTSLDPGDPAYGQLASSCAVEVRTGGEDGSEIGVYHFLQQALREANLRSSLRQYLRFGLEAGILYES